LPESLLKLTPRNVIGFPMNFEDSGAGAVKFIMTSSTIINPAK